MHTSRPLLAGLVLLGAGCLPGCAGRLAHVPMDQAAPALPSPTRVEGARGLALASVLQTAAARNPRLLAARERWLAARARITLAGSWPDPMFTYTEMLEPIQTRVGPMERTLALKQTIPQPAKLAAARGAASEAARVDEIAYHIALRDTVAEAKVIHAELVYLHEALAIVAQNQHLADTLIDRAGSAVDDKPGGAAPAATLFETLRAQSARAQLDYDRITLNELLRAEEAKLNGLLALPAEQAVARPLPLRYRPLGATRADLAALADARRQEIAAATHAMRAASLRERVARLERLPTFTVGIQHTVIGERPVHLDGNGDNATGLMVGVSLPWWGQKNRARIAEAQHRQRAAAYTRTQERSSVAGKLARWFYRAKNAARLVTLYEETLLPQARAALERSDLWEIGGEATTGRLLEARMTWFNFRLAAARARADHEQAVARLEQVVGISLGHLRTEVAPR